MSMNLTEFITNRKSNFIKITIFVLFLIVFYQIAIETEEKTPHRVKFNLKNNTDKWIIVTTINAPTEQIKKLASTKGFQLLVIGDRKTASNWYFNNTIFLSVDSQSELNYKSFRTIPFNSYNRKNIGYLFAIQNGDKYIYDTDDDNAPIVDLLTYFNLNENDHGLILDENAPKVLNPYSHFGQPSIWPRGFPLTEIQSSNYNNYICGKRRKSFVQQGVVNGDPDVDAIFRLTKSMNYKRINITFDITSPSFQLPVYKLTPYNSQNTFFHYEAFWSLYLPITVSFRLTDIWRSYWAQRLLWLLNGTVSFYGPNAVQFRNSHSYLKDFEEEQDMYLKTEKLVKFLYEWRCMKNKFYACVLDLSYEMAINQFWKTEEVGSIKNWLNDLNKIGYNEPKIVNYEYDSSFKMDRHFLNENKNPSYFKVRFTPKYQKAIEFDNYCCDGKPMSVYDRLESIKYLENFCSLSNYSLKYDSMSFLETKTKNQHIILIVTFNFEPNEVNIKLIKNTYDAHFENIIFCGRNITKLLNNDGYKDYKRFDSFTLVDAELNDGFHHYHCMAKAYELNFNTAGYLLMSDDVLLKYWKLRQLDVNKIWYYDQLNCNRELNINAHLVNCQQKHAHMCMIAAYNFFNHIESIRNGTLKESDENLGIINEFLISLNKHADVKANAIKFCFLASDIFYLPRAKLKAYHYLSGLFTKFNVVLELAVPTMLAGLDPDKSIEIIGGLYYWMGVLFDFANYKHMNFFAHPAKLSYYKGSKAGYDYCSNFIQDKLQND